MSEPTKTALITGASRGIGRETAIKLTDAGYRVIITSRNEARLKETAALASGDAHFFAADLTNSRDLAALHNFVQTMTGSLDILINNAGLLINKPFLECTEEDWNAQMNCNLTGPFRLIQTLAPLMKSGGHIVNIGSMGGFQGSSKFPGLTPYSVAKGGLAILSECLAAELAGFNISVNCLCLGAVQTEMLEQAFPGLNAPVSPEDMGFFVSDFAISGQKFFNGKVLPVSLADPN